MNNLDNGDPLNTGTLLMAHPQAFKIDGILRIAQFHGLILFVLLIAAAAWMHPTAEIGSTLFSAQHWGLVFYPLLSFVTLISWFRYLLRPYRIASTNV
ncbi:hypothetical protein MIB92_13595 [Aestuariirhabdus sp. Z084]|uniref:hypothetical protein n=1 Tax=Aestuariirhabdus haliotis TaxID=2918751 RepID=UPI00201B3EAA|nr:hypothetical protein [Aestuariirhabdus haliotis]MCL6416689.1 hypothetical protein [Aestuariirhabdus haliotis]MCL6420722.1 hypothetical protein [Aestuariirhabdus haliotis]